MGLFDKLKRRSAANEEAMRLNYISARQQNLNRCQKLRVEPGVLSGLFAETKKTKLVKVGDMDLAGQRPLLSDPCYLGSNISNPTERTVPPGSYPVFAAVLDTKMTGRVISGVKIKFSDALTVRHEIAMPLGMKAWQADDPMVYPGVNIETGVVCCVDEVTELPFAAYMNRYYDKHPGQDLIHDELLPLVEEKGYAMWTIPGTEYSVPVLSAGLGAGIYNSYWGFDTENRLTELVLPLVYPELFD